MIERSHLLAILHFITLRRSRRTLSESVDLVIRGKTRAIFIDVQADLFHGDGSKSRQILLNLIVWLEPEIEPAHVHEAGIGIVYDILSARIIRRHRNHLAVSNGFPDPGSFAGHRYIVFNLPLIRECTDKL